jgi:hypothetical protein
VNCPARNRPPQNIPDSNTPPSHSHSNSAAPRLIVSGPNFLFMWSSPASRIKVSSAFCVDRSPSARSRRLSLLWRGGFTPRIGRSSSGKYPYKGGNLSPRDTILVKRNACAATSPFYRPLLPNPRPDRSVSSISSVSTNSASILLTMRICAIRSPTLMVNGSFPK